MQLERNSASTYGLFIETTSYSKATKGTRKIINESHHPPSASKSMQADVTSEVNTVSEEMLSDESSSERSQTIVATNAGLSREGKNLLQNSCPYQNVAALEI